MSDWKKYFSMVINYHDVVIKTIKKYFLKNDWCVLLRWFIIIIKKTASKLNIMILW